METNRPTNPAAEEILGGYFPVLDHGFVALVDYMGTDDSIERAARVSYGYGTRSSSATRGLIRYLRRHRHTTPSEMIELKFHCAMPMFVARQWIRHRTACLVGDTELHFDLPGGLRRRGNQLFKMTVAELWLRFQPTRNEHRPDKQRNPYYRRDRVRAMHLRQMNERTGRIEHTRVIDVSRSGTKPVFRMQLEDGKTIESTADHRYLFSDGWSTLARKVGLHEQGGRAVWRHGDNFLYVNGRELPAERLYRDRAWLHEQYHVQGRKLTAIATDAEWCPRPRDPWNKLTVGKLVRVVGFQYVGMKETYDIEVEGPFHNFIANGIVTHNSVNEYSGRYSLMPLLFYRPEYAQFALQSEVNRQGRSGVAERALYEEAIGRWEKLRRLASEIYGGLVGEDVARELARIDLPLSTYTQWYWKIDLHNLLHFLSLRADAHAQWEIRAYARVMAAMLKRVAPLSYEAWIDYDVCGARLSRAELDVLRDLLEADERGIRVRSGAGAISTEGLAAAGLSGREIRELAAKLQPADRPDFELDLTDMRSAEEFEARMREAVPGDFE